MRFEYRLFYNLENSTWDLVAWKFVEDGLNVQAQVVRSGSFDEMIEQLKLLADTNEHDHVIGTEDSKR